VDPSLILSKYFVSLTISSNAARILLNNRESSEVFELEVPVVLSVSEKPKSPEG